MTEIEWTDDTWNPIRALRAEADGTMRIGWHCEHASPGCINCYSETRNLSGRCNMGTKLPFKPGHRKDVEIFLDEKTLLQPLRWQKPRMIFVCSMTDLFADFVKDEWLDRIFDQIEQATRHLFQVLTKRSSRMLAYLRKRWAGKQPPAHIWLGVSVEDQQRADERIPDLLATPAAVRWLSCEPLLGPLDLGHLGLLLECRHEDAYVEPDTNACICSECDEMPHLDWIVAGGESGPRARPMHPDWARSLRDQCDAAGVPFHFKQWGAWFPGERADAGDREYAALDIEHDPDAENWQGRWKYVLCGPPPSAGMFRVGKKRAGRRLDGVEHNGMPETAHG